MDKVAFYKEEIMEKVAARAWKKHIGDLSEKSIELLKKHNILNHEREYNGLLKGTEGILKRVGAKAKNFGDDEFRRMIIDDIESSKGYKKFIKSQFLSADNIADMISGIRDQGGGFVSYFGKNHKFVNVGDVNNHRFQNSFMPHMMKGLPKSNFDKKYLEAILNRHEANELRFANNAIKRNRTSINFGDRKISAANYFSHMSPKVLGAESVDTAIAPKHVKEKMMTLRNATGEINDLRLRGLDYGRSGVFDKKINRKIEKNIARNNKSRLQPIVDQVLNSNR